MAKICDGCGAREDDVALYEASIELDVKGWPTEAGEVPGGFEGDLCSDCIGRASERINPTMWTKKRKPRAPKVG
jgi:hypothetical protein